MDSSRRRPARPMAREAGSTLSPPRFQQTSASPVPNSNGRSTFGTTCPFSVSTAQRNLRSPFWSVLLEERSKSVSRSLGSALISSLRFSAKRSVGTSRAAWSARARRARRTSTRTLEGGEQREIAVDRVVGDAVDTARDRWRVTLVGFEQRIVRGRERHYCTWRRDSLRCHREPRVSSQCRSSRKSAFSLWVHGIEYVREAGMRWMRRLLAS
jgi:hypothetical protein